jgi:hypothetical protein
MGMKLRIALLAFAAAAGVFASIAVASPPPWAGNPHAQAVPAGSTTGTTASTTTAAHGKGHTTTTTTTTTADRKVLVCHKVGNGHYVLISVSVHSAPAKGSHGGDVLATNKTCPGTIQGHGRTTTAATTTVATTTTTSS